MISCLDFFLSDEPLVCSEVVHNEGLMHNSGHYDILSTFCIPDFVRFFYISHCSCGRVFLTSSIISLLYTIGLRT
jgi:hypothetical protein